MVVSRLPDIHSLTFLSQCTYRSMPSDFVHLMLRMPTEVPLVNREVSFALIRLSTRPYATGPLYDSTLGWDLAGLVAGN